jgi:hypothetical protein
LKSKQGFLFAFEKGNAGYNAIRNHIQPEVEGASAVLVLLGQDTQNHDWIRAGLELANSFKRQFIVSSLFFSG